MENKLQYLKVGDYVFWSSQYRIGVKTILSIDRTHIKTTEGMRGTTSIQVSLLVAISGTQVVLIY